jgi:tetratricopeptide (TPR) repeat protein
VQPDPPATPRTTADPNPETPKVLRLERRQELEHHLKGSPTDLESYMELGRIYRAEGRPADARRVFQQALQIFPDESQLLWEHEEAILARSLQQLREVTDVARRIDTAETDRELKRCQNDWACRRMDVCRARLKRDPSLHHLRVVLAEAMHDAGLHEGAMEELRPVLEHDEFSPTAHLIQGKCLLEMGKDVEAMASLRAAALRRSVVAPPRVRVAALRLLCDTAERLGVTLTLAQYRQHLHKAEQDLAELSARGQHPTRSGPQPPPSHGQGGSGHLESGGDADHGKGVHSTSADGEDR